MRGGMRSMSGGSRHIRGGWDSPEWVQDVGGLQKPPRRQGFVKGLRRGADKALKKKRKK